MKIGRDPITQKAAIPDPSGVVTKLIFESRDAIAESVGYKYEDRRVVCFSCQSGCRVGCSFCGSGGHYLRDLTAAEIRRQVDDTLDIIGRTNNIQLMAMSMGEPTDCWETMAKAMPLLLEVSPRVCLSTVGLNRYGVYDEIIAFGEENPQMGLQISLHHWDDERR